VSRQFDITWTDSGREPKCAPDPQYPAGIDIDCTEGAKRTCLVSLPYPAKRCGVYLLKCTRCGLLIGITTAGRADDPRSVRLPCQELLQ
jgi:hypothetical protein